MVAPNSCTSACIIWSSVSPLAICWSTSCNTPFAVGHGPENSPPGCEQPAAVMLHEPHMHLTFPPISFARAENCSAPAGASSNGRAANPSRAATAIQERPLVMALSQCDGRSDRMWQRVHRGGLLRGRQNQHGAAIRQQRDQRPKHHRDAAKPNPFHQGVQEGINASQLRFQFVSCGHHVPFIFFRRIDWYLLLVFVVGEELPIYPKQQHHPPGV